MAHKIFDIFYLFIFTRLGIYVTVYLIFSPKKDRNKNEKLHQISKTK